MKLIRIIFFLAVLIILAMSAAWWYLTDQIASELNTKYAGKKIPIKGVDNSDYYISFEKIVPTGFPYKISFEVINWHEESRSAEITYNLPVVLGYDLVLQKLYIDYSGDITAAYKPAKNGFGSLIRISNYHIAANLPLSYSLFKTLKDLKDPIEIINYTSGITVSSDKVEIFDLINKEKYYDKQYEKAKVTFVKSKYYESLDDLLNNIPQEYTVNYVVKTSVNQAKPRIVPVSMLYAFSSLPSGIDLSIDAKVKTSAKKFDNFLGGMSTDADISYDSGYIKFIDMKVKYDTNANAASKEVKLNTNTKIQTKKGLFDQLFKEYELYSALLLKTAAGRLLDHEVRYIIKNKEAFRFKDLEDNKYDLSINLTSLIKKDKRRLKVDNFSIFSKDSGVQLEHNMETIVKTQEWTATGKVFVKNYPAVIEFTSGYVYRFGKFRLLNEVARSIYVEVNKSFVKSISDHPESTSNDISLAYNLKSVDIADSTVGVVKVKQIPELYTTMLYQKLFDKVGPGGDVLRKMQEIMPGLKIEENTLKKVLPQISSTEEVTKQVEKMVPEQAKGIISNIIPKQKSGNLLEGLIK